MRQEKTLALAQVLQACTEELWFPAGVLLQVSIGITQLHGFPDGLLW